MDPSSPPECRICRLPLVQSTTLVRSGCHFCPFCGRTFHRVDGARRHSKTCRSRGDRPLPPEAKRGRKVHACDGCSQIKLLCDAKSPCARCISKGLTCTYGRICADPTHLTGSRQEEFEEVQAHLGTSEGVESKSSRQSALSFLLGCADPSGGSVNDVILDGEPEHSRDIQLTPGTEEFPSTRAPPMDTIDPRLLFLGFVGPPFDTPLEDYGMSYSGHVQDLLSRLLLDTSDDKLETRVRILILDLQEITATMPNFETFPSLDLFAAFFTLTTFRDYIAAFFQRGHLLASIIHVSTLHLGSINTTLLLAIALLGSTYLHYRKEIPISPAFTLALQELAEKYIFHSMKRSFCITTQSADSRDALELCQAAYIIETLQMFVKDPIVRQRIINKRHPTLVNFLRSLDVIGIKHVPSQSEVDLHLFVIKESWIRLVTWTFINDAWLILFSNHIPAMTLSDMSGHLPCMDGLWHTDSIASFNSLRAEQGFSMTFRCLRDLVARLLDDEWTEDTAINFKQLDVQHLHILVLAFQHVTFHHHTSVLIDSNSSVLLRGLDRWNLSWNAAINNIDDEEQKWLGVVKYSAGIAFITRRILEVSKTEDRMQSKYLQRTVTYDTRALYQFIQQFCMDES